MTEIIFDIETAPNDEFIASVGPERFQDFMTRKKLERADEACFHPTFGRVVCITIEHPTDGVLSFAGADEVDILQQFGQYTDSPVTLVGHNIKGFDIPFLAFRYLVHRMPVPFALRVAGKKPWEITHIDTMELLKFGGWSQMSLGDAALALGFEDPKAGGENKIMPELVRAGKFDQIAQYCELDVATTRKIYKTLRKFGGA